jgi:hypothetical protein
LHGNAGRGLTIADFRLLINGCDRRFAIYDFWKWGLKIGDLLTADG